MLTVCTDPIKGALKLTYQEDDPLDQSASIYFDPQLRTVWLCPGALPWLVGESFVFRIGCSLLV